LATRFETEIDVRFGDCDPASIVYYPTLYHYCHVAFEDAWRGALGISYPDLVGRERIGFPTVHVETDFATPARYGDRLTVAVAVTRVGDSSADFRFDARVGDRRVFRSTHTVVCLNLDTFASMPIPEPHRSALLRLAE
jgi:YbgC/YbaW family acyl-CoA thioester hydrolase